MACTPFEVERGPFINTDLGWSPVSHTERAGKTVDIDSADRGLASRIQVSFEGRTLSRLATMMDSIWSYKFFGSDNNLVVRESVTVGGSTNHKVNVIDFTGPSIDAHEVFSADGETPEVHYSPGSGSAFLIFNARDGDYQHLAIFRSNNGGDLCRYLGSPFHAELEIGGEVIDEADGSKFLIKHGGERMAVCPLPSGQCSVMTGDFDDAVIFGAPELASTTAEFRITNMGTDCLIINPILPVAPFAVTAALLLPSTSVPHDMPVSLKPMESLRVTVTFSPTTEMLGGAGRLELHEDLLVDVLPERSRDCVLTCRATVRRAMPSIAFSGTLLDFGSVRLLTIPVRSLSLDVINDGDVDLSVSYPGSIPVDPISPDPLSVFQWSPLNETIPFDERRTLTVWYYPQTERPIDETTITVMSDDPRSPHTITLRGHPCSPNAAIEVPPRDPMLLDFGRIERGYVTVRTITIRNTGDGPLMFNARISGPDVSLYGLQLESGLVTDLPTTRSYTVDPRTLCGSLETGSGETIVAVGFHADDAPRVTHAQLIIESGNATNVPPGTTFTFDLSAEIIASAATIDVGLVQDRSGSMGDIVGERSKSEAAIAGGRLFAQLMRPDVHDRLTAVRFNQMAEIVDPVIDPIQPVKSTNQASLVDTINGTSLAPAGATSIAAGVMVCLDKLSTPRPDPLPDVKKMMVLLSDGEDNTPYLNPADHQNYSILGHPLGDPPVPTRPVSIPSEIRIFSIGLGREEDIGRAELDLLSGGSAYLVTGDLTGNRFFDLEKHFTQIYMNMTDTSPLHDPVYTIEPGEVQEIEFDVLRGDVRALVVVYDRHDARLPFEIVTPRRETIEVTHVPPGFQLRSGFTVTARFMEIMMPMGEPDRYAGRWRVQVKHPGEVCSGDSRTDERRKWGFVSSNCSPYGKSLDYGIAIGVGSNFRMQPFVTPGVVHVGEPILVTAVIAEAGLPVTDCSVTVEARSPSGSIWNLTLLDDGAHDDNDANDGEYARRFLHTAEGGSYEFTFRADSIRTRPDTTAETVHREAVLAKYVVGRIPITPQPEPPKSTTSRDQLYSLLRVTSWIVVGLLILILIMLWFRL